MAAVLKTAEACKRLQGFESLTLRSRSKHANGAWPAWTRLPGGEPECPHPRTSRLQPKVPDEAALPGRLHGAWRVVLPDVGDRLAAGHAVEHRDAGKRRAGPAVPSGTGDLDPLCLRPCPGLAQRLGGIRPVGREPEVRPADPPGRPGKGGRLLASRPGT